MVLFDLHLSGFHGGIVPFSLQAMAFCRGFEFAETECRAGVRLILC